MKEKKCDSMLRHVTVQVANLFKKTKNIGFIS